MEGWSITSEKGCTFPHEDLTEGDPDMDLCPCCGNSAKKLEDATPSWEGDDYMHSRWRPTIEVVRRAGDWMCLQRGVWDWWAYGEGHG